MRPTWDEYFGAICQLVATRSTCLKYQVGCVLVKGNQIIATGYNGVPSGEVHCIDQGFCRPGVPMCGHGAGSRAIHAEKNAVGQAAKHGVSTEGAIAYCTHYPCKGCQEVLLAAGIAHTYYLEGFDEYNNQQHFAQLPISKLSCTNQFASSPG